MPENLEHAAQAKANKGGKEKAADAEDCRDLPLDKVHDADNEQDGDDSNEDPLPHDELRIDLFVVIIDGWGHRGSIAF